MIFLSLCALNIYHAQSWMQTKYTFTWNLKKKLKNTKGRTTACPSSNTSAYYTQKSHLQTYFTHVVTAALKGVGGTYRDACKETRSMSYKWLLLSCLEAHNTGSTKWEVKVSPHWTSPLNLYLNVSTRLASIIFIKVVFFPVEDYVLLCTNELRGYS